MKSGGAAKDTSKIDSWVWHQGTISVYHLRHVEEYNMTMPSDWGQEDVEDHGEDDKDDVAHYTEPETWVFEELLVVGAEEDVTDGHPGDNPPEMGHKGDLVEGRSNKRGFQRQFP